MKRTNRTFCLLGLTGFVLMAASLWSFAAPAGAQGPVMRLVPDTQTLDVEDGNFAIDVMIENVSGLAAFEFTITYDPDVVRLVGVERGPFLESTGRQVFCPAPHHYSPAVSDTALDAIRFGCTTLGKTPEGPSGDGLLATVTFATKGAGTTQLALGATNEVYGIANHLGDSIEVMVVGANVRVTGQGPEPTPRPDDPTPIPTERPSTPGAATATPASVPWLTPQPGQTPLSRLVDPDSGIALQGGTSGRNGSGGSGSGRSGSSGDASNAQGGSSRGSPRAGTGPEQGDADWWPAVSAWALVIGGAVLISSSIYIGKTRSRVSSPKR